MKLHEILDLESQKIQEYKNQKNADLNKSLSDALDDECFELLGIKPYEQYYRVDLVFTLDGYKQEMLFIWDFNENQETLIEKIKARVSYIKELRQKYPQYCRQNDYIQTNSNFRKTLHLTDGGQPRDYIFNIFLANYMELPNTTRSSFGGGDYEIKKTPERVKEFNKNIDKTIDFLIDCITELKNRKR